MTTSLSKPLLEWRQRHPLRLWLAKSGTRLVDFVAAMGTCRAAVYRWLNGEVMPIDDHLDLMDSLSGGAVSYQTWRKWWKAKPGTTPQARGTKSRGKACKGMAALSGSKR